MWSFTVDQDQDIYLSLHKSNALDYRDRKSGGRQYQILMSFTVIDESSIHYRFPPTPGRKHVMFRQYYESHSVKKGKTYIVVPYPIKSTTGNFIVSALRKGQPLTLTPWQVPKTFK